jgi:hypothetical protein
VEAAKIRLMANRRNFQRARQRDRVRSRPKSKQAPTHPRAVHPNSMAARKWGRTHWD